MFFLLSLLLSSQHAVPSAFFRFPDIQGDQVVFTCEGDLWLGDLVTHNASRLTHDEGQEMAARFSPDAKQIAFAAQYGGARELYIMPTEGGIPTRLTYSGTTPRPCDWTPNGSKILYAELSGRPGYVSLSLVPAAGGLPTKIPLEFADTASFAPDGHRFTFTRFARSQEAWFSYQGGTKNDIWVGDLETKSFKRIYSATYTSEFPVWAGDRIYFAKDEGDNRFSVNSIKPDGSGFQRIAGPYNEEIRALQTDGKRLIYEKGTGLEMIDLATGEISSMEFSLTSDRLHALPFLTPAESKVQTVSLGATGKRILVESRGQIVSIPAKEGDARVVMAKDGARLRWPSMSRDAKKIAYVSDETREQQLYIADAEGANPKQLTKDSNRQITGTSWSPDGNWIAFTDSADLLRIIKADGTGEAAIGKGSGWDGPPHDFSPDSRWIVYSENDPITYISSLKLYEIATKKTIMVSDGYHDDFAPKFSIDGKWIVFLSHRNIAPKWDTFIGQLDNQDTAKVYLLAVQKDGKSPLLAPDEEESGVSPSAEEETDEAKPKEQAFHLDVDGIYDRFVEVPMEPAEYLEVALTGDRVIARTEEEVSYYDLKEKKGGQLAGAPDFQLSADGKKLLLGEGPKLQVVDATVEEVKPTDGVVKFGNLQLRIDPVKEWEEIYWDSWRLLRDYFYVANMHGADWPALGEKYAKFLPAVRSRDEVSLLIRWLQSELTTGHMFRDDGDTRTLFKPVPQGFLGAELEPDPSGCFRIKKIYRGDGFSVSDRSPLAAPGLGAKDGDYLIEVAGISTKDGMRFMQGLANRAGQIVAIKVNDKPTADGARTVRIKPAPSESGMKYRDWVQQNRNYVDKASGGKIAYLHLQAMGEEDMADFIKQYYPVRGKDALIVDTRFNGGGNVSGAIINVLMQKPLDFFNQRNQVSQAVQRDYFPGPLACLINEYNASDGEQFPTNFRAAGLGPLIGRRTWGGLVGSSPGWPLVDGGVINVPNYGAWTPQKGWIVEGHGVDPDIDVESDPNAYVKGDDPQLDRAIAYLQGELRKHPVVRPHEPPAPIKVHPKK